MAPIGRRAEVRSIARLEPPVPGRASHEKLLRLRVATFEAPKLVRAKQRAYIASRRSFPFSFTFLLPSCYSIIAVRGRKYSVSSEYGAIETRCSILFPFSFPFRSFSVIYIYWFR